jgi:hypothetical protein
LKSSREFNGRGRERFSLYYATLPERLIMAINGHARAEYAIEYTIEYTCRSEKLLENNR